MGRTRRPTLADTATGRRRLCAGPEPEVPRAANGCFLSPELQVTGVILTTLVRLKPDGPALAGLALDPSQLGG